MAKVKTEDIGNFAQHYPKQPVIVTARAGGRDNAMTAAWHTSISFRPPLYGVSLAPKRFTYRLIEESQQFGVNFLSIDQAEIIAAVGGSQGEKIDKFERFSLKKEDALKLDVPLLADAYAAYECQVVDLRTYGDHIFVVGEIAAVHLAEEAFAPSRVVDLKIRPALYLGAELYVTCDRGSLCLLDREVYGKGGNRG